MMMTLCPKTTAAAAMVRVVSTTTSRVVRHSNTPWTMGTGKGRAGAVLVVTAAALYTQKTSKASWNEGSSSSNNNNTADTNSVWSQWKEYAIAMVSSSSSSQSNDKDDNKPKEDDDDNNDQQSQQQRRVVVELEPEVVETLPVMPLETVIKTCDTSSNRSNQPQQLLVTYDGIVYDVTEFIHNHPGGYDLLHTAVGYDLQHFFDNYTVHSQSAKAALWLAPLAIGKLSRSDAARARRRTTPHSHVSTRMRFLNRTRRRILVVASTLPLWMTVRSILSWMGQTFLGRPLAVWLSRALPVSVPGVTPGSERLVVPKNSNDSKQQQPYSVAIIGGGIAGCGAAWALSRSNFKVTLFEARHQLGGNARTFDWDVSKFATNLGDTVKSCVSVTAWPPIFYKNYTCLLELLNIPTVHQPLSWFINSKVPGYEGTLWEADPAVYKGSLRKVFEKDFQKYKTVVGWAQFVTNAFTFKWAPWRRNDTLSMYDSHQGLGLLNPMNVVPLYSLFKMVGGSDAWWNIVFTPQYTASFLVDELRPFPAVFGPLIEQQIPLNPDSSNSWQGTSKRSATDCNITTCVTWKDAGKGIRKVFELLVQDVDVKTNTRIRQVQVLENGKKRVYDEYDNFVDVDRVIFACPANAIGNMYPSAGKLARTIFSTPVYADDHHPSTGHMHAVMHSDGSVIPKEFRDECLKRASNYVEVTKLSDGTLNIENQYNFGVQTPGPGIYDLPLKDKPVMLIGHALGEDKSYDPNLIRGQGNHARAHPLYSGWNVAAQLCLRLVQGQNGVYFCSNWTTPGNCHDMSLLSGLICAHAIGAQYPFEDNVEAQKDFCRLRDLMGV